MLLRSVDDLLDFLVDIEDVALRLLHQSIAAGAVIAGVGFGGFPRQPAQRIDFASDGRNPSGIDRCDSLQVHVESDLGGIGILLRSNKQGLRGIGDPIFQVAEMLARAVRILDDRDELRFFGKVVRGPHQLTDQQRRGDSEDRQQQDRQED